VVYLGLYSAGLQWPNAKHRMLYRIFFDVTIITMCGLQVVPIGYDTIQNALCTLNSVGGEAWGTYTGACSGSRDEAYVPLQICHIKISRMYLECCFLKHEIKWLCDQKLLINYLKTLTSNTNHIGLAYFIRPTLPVPAGAAYSSRQRPYPLAG